MEEKDNYTKLRLLMAQHELTEDDVARLLSVSIHTVNAWRCRTRPDISDAMLEFLELKLK